MKVVGYEEIKLIKQSDKSTVLLMRELDGEKLFVQKILKGRIPVYSELSNYSHPYLPAIYEVSITELETTVLEEYIDGRMLDNTELSEKQVCSAAKELCCVLEFLHERGIIHRDIKPSNLILAKDGHIRLIDFDAARMPKEDIELEQDTRLLGTRGYAPPEQYGFAQTDVRTDIYSFGVTLGQLLGDKAKKHRYKRIIKKCTDLNPAKRYQSVREARKALAFPYQFALCVSAAVLGILISGLALAIQLNPMSELSGGPKRNKPIKMMPEQSSSQTADGNGLSAVQGEEERLVLTDYFQAPFRTLESVPVGQIGAEWTAGDPNFEADACLYKGDEIIAKVGLFGDQGGDMQMKKIRLWSCPSTMSELFMLSDYLELDMTKEEVLAALEEAIKDPTLPYPEMVLGADEENRIALFYKDYTITYFFQSGITVVEVEAYLPNYD